MSQSERLAPNNGSRPPAQIWRYNILGSLVLISIGSIACVLYSYSESTKWLILTLLQIYIGFVFIGVGWCKFGVNCTKSMDEWNAIFEQCECIQSISSMHGLHRGEILQYNVWVSPSQNIMLMHHWFGKCFDANTGTAAALIVQSVCGIRTYFKWNIFPLGHAKLTRMQFEGKHSVAMQYQLAPVTDHMREYVDEDGNKCWLGVMVVAGFKLMYFKLYRH